MRNTYVYTSCILSTIIIFVFASFVHATIVVPRDYATIQEGINHAASGETVLVQPDTINGCILYVGVSSLGRGNAYIANNIFTANTAYGIYGCTGTATNFDIKNNNFFGNSPAELRWCSEYSDIDLFNLTEPDARDNISCNPAFTGPGNYHLTSASCCIDYGTADSAPIEDLDGDPRPVGAGYDIGADEYSDFSVPIPGIYTILLLMSVIGLINIKKQFP